MNLKNQKKLAGQILKCSPSKVVFDTESLEEIKESITKVDIRNLIKKNIVGKKITQGPSRGRARKIAEQKAKGRRKGLGSRKGKKTARLNPKRDWINRIRKQRQFLLEMKERETLDTYEYRLLYRRAGGGSFRSIRHLKIVIDDIKNK